MAGADRTVASVTVSVVSHGQHALVGSLLEDLAALSSPVIAHVVLTQNLPEPEPTGLDRLRRRTQVTVLRNARPLGFAANHNQAFRHCGTPAFAVLNPDLRLPDDPFPPLLEALAPDDVGLSVPTIVDSEGASAPFARPLYTPMEVVARKLGWATREPAEPAWMAGTFMLLRSRAFDAIGGFDERFRLYVEDVDLCARLRLAGWRITASPNACAIHIARYASHRSLRHMYWHASSMFKFWSSPTFWRYRALLNKQRSKPADVLRQDAAVEQKDRLGRP